MLGGASGLEGDRDSAEAAQVRPSDAERCCCFFYILFLCIAKWQRETGVFSQHVKVWRNVRQLEAPVACGVYYCRTCYWCWAVGSLTSLSGKSPLLIFV